MGSRQRPGKVGSCDGLQAARDSVQSVPTAPFLDMTWELAVGSWLSLSLRINEKVLSNLLYMTLLKHGEVEKMTPPEVPSIPNQSVIQLTTELREESPRYEGCQHIPVCCI